MKIQKRDLFLVSRSWPFLYGFLALSVPKCRGVVSLRIENLGNQLLPILTLPDRFQMLKKLGKSADQLIYFMPLYFLFIFGKIKWLLLLILYNLFGIKYALFYLTH